MPTAHGCSLVGGASLRAQVHTQGHSATAHKTTDRLPFCPSSLPRPVPSSSFSFLSSSSFLHSHSLISTYFSFSFPASPRVPLLPVNLIRCLLLPVLFPSVPPFNSPFSLSFPILPSSLFSVSHYVPFLFPSHSLTCSFFYFSPVSLFSPTHCFLHLPSPPLLSISPRLLPSALVDRLSLPHRCVQ